MRIQIFVCHSTWLTLLAFAGVCVHAWCTQTWAPTAYVHAVFPPLSVSEAVSRSCIRARHRLVFFIFVLKKQPAIFDSGKNLLWQPVLCLTCSIKKEANRLTKHIMEFCVRCFLPAPGVQNNDEN
jgi:hypothetical protein